MYIPSPRTTKRARIEIIPLIDIMFFLLATFVMVSLSMVRNQGVPVHLPVASTSVAQERKDYISITVTESGDLYFNKEACKLDDLIARLAKVKSEQGDPKIFINGDGKAAFEQVVAVLDATRRVGISRVAIETKKSGETLSPDMNPKVP